MFSLRRLACPGLFLGLCVLIGCGGGDSRPRVAFVSNNPEAFWSIAEAGAKKAAEETGVRLEFRKPSPGNVKTQKEEIDNVINRGAKAVAVSVIDPKNQTEYLDQIASKVDLLTQDNDAPNSKRLAYIGTDNYQAGRAAGKLVKEALGENGGQVIIFVGQLDALNARQRRQGVIDEIAGKKDLTYQEQIDLKPSPDGETFGKFKIVNTYLDQPEGSKKARENAEDALGKLPPEGNVAMVGLWAYNPPQILGAVSDKVKDAKTRERIKIIGFDEDFATLDGIKDGSIYATVVQDPYGFGYESVKLMAALAKGDRSGLPKDGTRYVPHRIIAREAEEKNGLKRLPVNEFRSDLEKLLGKKK